MKFVNKTAVTVFLSIAIFFKKSGFRLPSTRCMAPEIPHNKGSRRGFMKLLFQLLRHGDSFYPSLCFLVLLYSFKQDEKLAKEGVDKLLRLLLITSHKTLACTHAGTHDD